MNRSQLPESLEMISKSEVFSSSRHRWNTNEEIASILIGFDKHEEWLSKEVEIRYSVKTLITIVCFLSPPVKAAGVLCEPCLSLYFCLS